MIVLNRVSTRYGKKLNRQEQGDLAEKIQGWLRDAYNIECWSSVR